MSPRRWPQILRKACPDALTRTAARPARVGRRAQLPIGRRHLHSAQHLLARRPRRGPLTPAPNSRLVFIGAYTSAYDGAKQVRGARWALAQPAPAPHSQRRAAAGRRRSLRHNSVPRSAVSTATGPYGSSQNPAARPPSRFISLNGRSGQQWAWKGRDASPLWFGAVRARTQPLPTPGRWWRSARVRRALAVR